MKNFKNLVQGVCTFISGVLERFAGRLGGLTDAVAFREERLSRSGEGREPDSHLLEVAQECLRLRIEHARSIMNDVDLRWDLERQYGKTGWAMKVVDEILSRRREARSLIDA